MKKFKKSSWLTSALFIYITIMAIYLLPRNTQTGDLEKYATVGVSYLIVLLLWFVLRRKEKLAAEREKELKEIEERKKKMEQ